MLTIAVPRPPRFDLLLVAIIIASGLAFFAVCADAHASSIVLTDRAPIWTDASSLSLGNAATRALYLDGGVAGVGPNAANGGSVTLTAGSAGIRSSSIVIAGNTPMHAGAVRIAYAGTDREVVDEDGTHFVGAGGVDVNGDPIVTLDILFSAMRSASYFHEAHFVTREKFSDHEDELAGCIAIAAVGGGVAGAGLSMLLGATLFSRVFSMRRWISRAHRSLEKKKQAQQAATHL